MTNAVQTSYSLYLTAGLEGQLLNTADLDLWNFAAETVIPYGRAVGRGASDNTCKLIEPDDSFLGVARNIISPENPLYADKTQYEIYEVVSVVRTGYIFVYSEQAVDKGDPVYYRVVAGTAPNNIIGRFRKDDDSGDAVLLPSATFEKTISAAGITVIRIPV